MIKVVVVEDEKIIRDGIIYLINDNFKDYSVVADYASAEEALNKMNGIVADVVFTDIRMGEISGIEFIKKLRIRFPQIIIVIISGYASFEYAKDAIKLGVFEYLLKPIQNQKLAQVLNRISNKLLNNNDNIKDANHIVKKVKTFVKNNYDKELSLRNIAEDLEINPQYLSTLFKEQTGINFSKYVKNKRMDYAKKMLQETNLRINEVAMLCGYQNEKYFSNVFKKEFSLTPSQYRNVY